MAENDNLLSDTDVMGDEIDDLRKLLASAPSLHDVLARPMAYEAWLKKAQEALNG